MLAPPQDLLHIKYVNKIHKIERTKSCILQMINLIMYMTLVRVKFDKQPIYIYIYIGQLLI